MMDADIRWIQRFSNFVKALQKLTEAVKYIEAKGKDAENNKSIPVLNELIKEGLIQRFEYTHELAWNVMKDYAVYQGNSTVGGSRDATREAFQLKLITDGHVWMEMIGSRNQTSHTFSKTTVDEICRKILSDYYPALLSFQANMEAKRSGAG